MSLSLGVMDGHDTNVPVSKPGAWARDGYFGEVVGWG